MSSWLITLFTIATSGATINKNMKLFDLYENQTVTGAGDNEPYYDKVITILRDIMDIPDNIELKVALQHKFPLDDGQNGLTIPNPNNPNQIFMFLNPNLVGAEVISTIAHELVHVKQLSDGRMDIQLDNGKYVVKWDGREIPNVRYSRSHPWEAEAHSQERGLMMKVIDQLGNVKSST